VSSTVVHQISSFSPPFETAGLTPVQVQVVAALAEGRSVVRAAAASGIHRSTIHNWIRTSEDFRAAVEQARSHFRAIVADQLNELSGAALDTLRHLLASPDTPPALRLHAALAVLERPGYPEPGWQLPEPVGRISARIPKPPVEISAPRNSPCPCGSGLKYKRCCGGPVSIPAIATVPAPPRPQG
jgi:transposase-like protein